MLTKTSANCPSQEQLIQLLDETKANDETISQHVETCVICQKKLDGITDRSKLSSFRSHAKARTNLASVFDPPKNEGDIGSLGDIAIERQIGSGGMGVVFRGRDDRLSRLVAVKVLSRRSSQESDARFDRELKAAARLDNDYIVPVYSAGHTKDDTPYLVMKLIEGKALKDRIKQGGLSVDESVKYIRQIALGLHDAHQSGLVHRDVKPGNILLDSEDGRAKLADFGMARSSQDKTLTQANVVAGTPQYMSPEQIADPSSSDGRCDIYSLGITLYECLTGVPPFRGQPIQVLEQHQHAEPIQPSRLNLSIPRDLENVCLMAIAKQPSRRYQDANLFAEDLKSFLEKRPVVARRISRVERLKMWCRRNREIAVLAAVSVGLLIMLGVGSTIAAWRLGVANKKAVQAEKMAENDRTAAVDSLGTLIGSLYDDLSNNAATIKTREKVVDAAISGLKSITEASRDRVVDQTAFRAYLKIGDLSSLRGSNEEAKEYYEKSIEIGKTLVAQHAKVPFHKRELAGALSRYCQHCIRLNSPKASELSRESRLILEQLIAQNPDDTESLSKLVIQHGYELAIIRFSSPDSGSAIINYGEAALKDIEQLFATSGQSSSANESAHAIHFCLGRAYLESNDTKMAGEHFVAARPFLEFALQETPEKVGLRASLAVLDRAQAMVLGSQGRIPEAVVLFEKALVNLKELSARNPDDITQQINIANTQSLMSAAYTSTGEYEKAIELLVGSIKIHQTVLEKSPDNVNSRMLIADSRLKIAQSQTRLHQWSDARDGYTLILKGLSEIKMERSSNPSLAFFESYARMSQKTMMLLTGETPEQVSSSSVCNALGCVVLKEAGQATSFELSDESRNLVATIVEEFEGENIHELIEYVHGLEMDPSFGFNLKLGEAQAYALIGRNCASSSDPGVLADSKKALNACIAAIKEGSNAPSLREFLMNERDLDWVRKSLEFQAYLGELNSAKRKK